MEFNLMPIDGSKVSDVAVVKDHAQRCQTLEQLLFDWIALGERELEEPTSEESPPQRRALGNSITWLGGTDDLTNEPATFVLFRIDGAEIASWQVNLQELKSLFPEVVAIDPMVPEPDDAPSARYHPVLGGMVVSKEDALRRAVSFLLTEQGQIDWGALDRDMLIEDFSEEEEKELDGLIPVTCHFGYRDLSAGWGMGEHCNVLLPIEHHSLG